MSEGRHGDHRRRADRRRPRDGDGRRRHRHRTRRRPRPPPGTTVRSPTCTSRDRRTRSSRWRARSRKDWSRPTLCSTTSASRINIGGTDYEDVDEHPMHDVGDRHPAQSSNVGTIKIARELGKDRLAHYLDAFGFGHPTGLGLPGESSGILLRAVAVQRHEHGVDPDRLRHRGHRDADARRVHDDRQRRDGAARRASSPRPSTPTGKRHDEPLAAPAGGVGGDRRRGTGMLQEVVKDGTGTKARSRVTRWPARPGPPARRRTTPASTSPPSPGSRRPTTPGWRRSWSSTRPRAASSAATSRRRSSSRSCGSRSPRAGTDDIVSRRRGHRPRWRPVPCTFNPVTEPRGRPPCVGTTCSPVSTGCGTGRASSPATRRRGRRDHPRQPPGRPRRVLRVHPGRGHRRSRPRARGAVAAVRSALLVERPLPLDVPQARGAERARRARAGRRRRSTAIPRRRCAARGHRHQRQDDHDVPARAIARDARATGSA